MSKKVAWDYIVPIVMPADLKGVTPGKLPESLLRAIPSGGKLHWRAADAWNAMVYSSTHSSLESERHAIRQPIDFQPPAVALAAALCIDPCSIAANTEHPADI